jgi:hypothetical protein
MKPVRARALAGKNFFSDPGNTHILTKIELGVIVDVQADGIAPAFHRQLKKKLMLFISNLAIREQVRRGFDFNPPPIDIPVSFKTDKIVRFSINIGQNYQASPHDKFLMERFCLGDEIDLEPGEDFESRFHPIFDGLVQELQNEVEDIQKERGIASAPPASEVDL